MCGKIIINKVQKLRKSFPMKNKVSYLLACVAVVRKGRGRELERETTREGGGRRGTPARRPLFSPFRLLIKKITKNNATVNDLLSNKSGRDARILVVFLALFFFCFS